MDTFLEFAQNFALEAGRILQVILGIGLVIFVHEAGHFLAARWCNVRVDVFSLGFGPRLFSRKRGDTTYQIALIPLGGYVKMAGEEPGDEEAKPSPDDLRSKPVGQRFLIFSGGVIMNVVFGLVVFPILFWFGIPFTQPLIGTPIPGGPAWEAGLEGGTRVLEVNGQSVITYPEIVQEIALGDPGACTLVIQRPGSQESESIEITPERSPTRGLFELGIPPPLDPERRVAIKEGSPAALAGVSSGDKWISIEGGLPGASLEETFTALASRGESIQANFESAESGEIYAALIKPQPSEEEGAPLVGVISLANQVISVRGDGWPAVGVRVHDKLLTVGDAPVFSHQDLISGLHALTEDLPLTLERDGQILTLTIPATPALNSRDVALSSAKDERRVRVVPRSAAEAAGLKSGDEILMVGQHSIDDQEGLLRALRSNTEMEAPSVLNISRHLDGQLTELTITVTAAPFPEVVYGIGLQRAQYIYSEKNPASAIAMGCGACLKFLKDSWLTLRGIATDRVPGNNVGGPIAIGQIAHDFASASWTKFFFFLCVLSMNLAFLNVLPIPLLDGGHLFFLLIEKLKGSPVSDRVMGYSQIAGLMLIGVIFVYILYNDVARTIG